MSRSSRRFLVAMSAKEFNRLQIDAEVLPERRFKLLPFSR